MTIMAFFNLAVTTPFQTLRTTRIFLLYQMFARFKFLSSHINYKYCHYVHDENSQIGGFFLVESTAMSLWQRIKHQVIEHRLWRVRVDLYQVCLPKTRYTLINSSLFMLRKLARCSVAQRPYEQTRSSDIEEDNVERKLCQLEFERSSSI